MRKSFILNFDIATALLFTSICFDGRLIAYSVDDLYFLLF
jgi:hypothetical protein